MTTEGRCQMAYTLLFLNNYYDIEVAFFNKEVFAAGTGVTGIEPNCYLAVYSSKNKPSYAQFRDTFYKAEGLVTADMALNSKNEQQIIIGFDGLKDLDGSNSGVVINLYNAVYNPEIIAERFVSEWNQKHREMAVSGAF